MNRSLWVFAGAFILFSALLYFGFDTSSKEQKQLERSRSASIRAADISLLEKNAREKLSGEQRAALESISYQLESESDDSLRAELLKSISGYWYRTGEPAVAGHYAEKVAEIENTDEAWSIAGTTYAYGIGGYEQDNIRQFCAEKAREAFEKAISLDPDELNHRINLAVTYAEYPLPDNPMKGIQMLLSLSEEYPEEPAVLLQLARFGMQTGQYERAIARLEKVLEIDRDNKRAACLLAEAYMATGQPARAEEFRNRCEN